MAPVEAAFAALWPQARRVNLVDDALPGDLEATGALTPAISARIVRLCEHAIAAGADGVLFTCSAFGPAIEQAARQAGSLPVLKPNQAMFDQALDRVAQGGSRIGLLGTFEPSMPSMAAEFHAMARARGLSPTLDTHCVPQAMTAARGGDIAAHDRLVAQGAAALAQCDLVMLAQFSTATALADVQAVLACPVLAAPQAAVQALQRLILTEPPGRARP
jgi:aspartate/glutamate racemase